MEHAPALHIGKHAGCELATANVRQARFFMSTLPFYTARHAWKCTRGEAFNELRDAGKELLAAELHRIIRRFDRFITEGYLVGHRLK